MSDHGTRRGLIPEDLLEFRWVDEIALAPSADRLAYTVKRPEAEHNGYVIHLYVRKLETGDVACLTEGAGQASAIAWSRDGARLAYAWQEGAVNALRVWTASTGEEQVYPLAGSAMSGLDWAPDGRRLVGVRWTAYRHPEDRGSRPGIPEPTIKVVRRLRYKQDGVGWVHGQFQQIWVLDLETGETYSITTSECDYMEPQWSPAGDRLTFIGLAREQNVALGQGQIFICEFPGGRPERLLPEWEGACRSPVWGDNETIAFAGHTHPAPTNRRVFMQPYLADVAAGTARKLSDEIDDEVGNYAVADQRKGLANITVKWPVGDPWIYFLLTEQGATNLFRINTQGEYQRLVSGDSVTFEYSPTKDGLVAYGQADPSNPGELYLWKNGEVAQLTDLNPWLRDHVLAVPESYWYQGLNNDRVHAWIMKPPGLDENRPYPTILYVHCSMFSWDFNHEFQCLVSAGYVVAYFNQRGTTAGYGQAWTRASEGDQGGGDYEEIMLGLDELVARPYIDEKRLGVTGGSCGGFMTNWIVGHTDRFAAAVTQRSITNQISFFGTADIGPECTERETGANPWMDLEAVWRQSPLAYAANVNTPLLIIHSDQDHRCPLEQAEQLFAALRWMGKEVELVIFEGESHGLSRGGRPGNRIERQRRILEWFARHLGG